MIDEKKLLQKLAQSLGAENVLEQLKEKKTKEKRILENMKRAVAKMNGEEYIEPVEEPEPIIEEEIIVEPVPILAPVVEQIVKPEPIIKVTHKPKIKKKPVPQSDKEKKNKEKRILENMKRAVAKMSGEEYIEPVEEPIIETVVEPVVVETPVVAEAPVEITEIGRQPEPEIPKKDIVNKYVQALSKATDQTNDAQQIADQIPDSYRKELDILKKSIADFHRFAQRHSQMGGGGEVNFAKLDDVDASGKGTGKFLTYNSANKKFDFQIPASTQTKPTFAYNGDGTLSSITYSNGDSKTFTYSSGSLSIINEISGGRTYRKTLNYTAGVLTSITEGYI